MIGVATFGRVPCELTADDIQWTLDPLPCAEAVALLALTTDDVIAYARDLQIELAAVRFLLHEAIAALQRSQQQLVRYQHAVYELRDLARTRRAA